MEKLPKTLLKRGRRTYGSFYDLPSGERIYLAWRDQGKDVFRNGRDTVSRAVREGVACWAIDDEHLRSFKRQGIRFVGVLQVHGKKSVKADRANGTIWLAEIDDWFDAAKAPLRSYEREGGAVQRYMFIQHFKIRPGRERIK